MRDVSMLIKNLNVYSLLYSNLQSYHVLYFCLVKVLKLLASWEVNELLKCAKKYQLTDDILSFAGLLMKVDCKLFEKCNLNIIAYITVFCQSGVRHLRNDVITLKFHYVAI